MAQGISSLQFLACIRLRKVIFFFFQNMRNLFAHFYLSKPPRHKSPFQCASCASVAEGGRVGLLEKLH